MADIYAPNTDVTVSLDLVTGEGDPIAATSASYAVYDEAGASVSSGVGFRDASDTEVSVTVGASGNAVGSNELGARQVVVTVSDGTNQYVLKTTYVLKGFYQFQVPQESALTMTGAEMKMTIAPSLMSQAWQYADPDDREAAMLEAWRRMRRLKLRPWRRNEKPDDTLRDGILAGDFRLADLTSAEWAKMPLHFVDAVEQAQLTEASVILEGDPSWDRRVDGIISETVGESSRMFRMQKPIIDAISPKAMAKIRDYVVRKVRLAR